MSNCDSTKKGMTNSVLLKKKIEESGVKRGFLVKMLETSYGWLNQKIENERPFVAWEINVLCEILGITDLAEKDRIFFAEDVEKSST